MRRRILRRKELLFTACGLMVCLWLATGAHAQIRLDNKKMIQFGWDEPDPAFMRKHIRRMEQSPFDGTVFHISYRSKNGRTGNFTWEAWGRTLFSERDLNDARKDLRRTRFRRFQHNFLRFNVTPADLDWFDDYSAVIGNARLAGKLARQGKARGILLDTETYKEALFDYRKQRDSGTKSWEEYAAQARRRGREIMQAFQRDFPGITIFLTMGYELPWLRCVADSRPLWECDYGLLAPFLNGMLEAADVSSRIVDGYELAYYFQQPEQFPEAYFTASQAVTAIVADPQKYRKTFSIAFGLWMDVNWRQNGWSATEPENNAHPPRQFEQLVRKALQTADEYVWIYNEQPR